MLLKTLVDWNPFVEQSCGTHGGFSRVNMESKLIVINICLNVVETTF